MKDIVRHYLHLTLWVRRKSRLKLYKIKKFFRNLRLWFEIIKTDEQWDYVFLEKVILHKLKLMKDFYDSGQDYTVADDTVKELNITIDALERLLKSDYIHFPEGKAPKLEVLDNESNGLFSELKTTYHEDFGEEMVEEVYRKSEEDEMKDRELVYKMLKEKSPSWWD